MTPDDIHQILRVFCASVSTLSLATVDEDGRPHAANVNFVADGDLNLYFISDPASAHSRHVLARPAVAATMYAPFREPAEIRGIQLRGVCEAVDGGDFERVWKIFCGKFPYAKSMEDRARSERFYRLTPRWIRYIDNAVSFGYKWETDWPPREDSQT